MPIKLPPYPALAALPALQAALAHVGCAVLSAPPGSGKTTTLPLALLEAPWLAGQKIILLEPRRVAARAAAARMASLLGEKVGDTVGYQIRFDRKIGPNTRIEVLTEGLLTRRLQSDAELPGVGLVIFDEFHERSLEADLALALALDARANLRPELKLLVMSATLDTQRVAALLGDAPLVEAHGTLHPISLHYLPQRADAPLDASVASAITTALADTPGDVLVFLPGAGEIRAVHRLVAARHPQIAIYPLYGELPADAQDAALAADPRGQRKVILATNIAQTSLTVEGVSTVVDAGLARVARYDLGAGATRLETLKVSRASAEQRAGRAGRLGPGHAYRLWSQEQHGRLMPHDDPEILNSDLSRLALELAQWGAVSPAELAFLDPPPTSSWNAARELLTGLGALDEAGKLTAHGKALARLPTAPRRAQLLLRGQTLGLAGLACWVAALLDERSPSSADFAESIEQLLAQRGDPLQLRRVKDSARQLAQQLGNTELPSRCEASDVARLLALAYPERIAKRRDGLREGLRKGEREVAYACADGGEARLPEHDPLARQPYLAIANWLPGTTRRIRSAAALAETDLRRDCAERIHSRPQLRWDAQSEAVIAEQSERLGQLLLSSRPLTQLQGPSAAAAAQAMLQGIRSLGLHCLPWSDASRDWQNRVESLRHWQAEAPWPAAHDEALLASLEDWLLPYLDGITRRSHLERLNLPDALNNLLDYPQQQALAKLAPTHLLVPSGNRHALSYQPGQAPALEVKLQEMFGSPNTPTVCDGRVKVVLHLLSPGRKPVAVTGDLASFWAKSYFEVKKDLRGRYPRHPWPDDPLAAQATARAKPRGT